MDPLTTTGVVLALVALIGGSILKGAGVSSLANPAAFVIVFIGGLGSMIGALAGGVLIGVSESVAGLLFTPSAKSMLSFALLIVVLVLRPQGLFPARG